MAVWRTIAIGLGVEHAVHALEVRDGGADADAGLRIDELEPAHGERRVALDVRPRAHVGALLRRRVGGEADDHARDRLRAGGRRPTGLGRARARGQGQQHSERRDDPCRPGAASWPVMAPGAVGRTRSSADGADAPTNGGSRLVAHGDHQRLDARDAPRRAGQHRRNVTDVRSNDRSPRRCVDAKKALIVHPDLWMFFIKPTTSWRGRSRESVKGSSVANVTQ